MPALSAEELELMEKDRAENPGTEPVQSAGTLLLSGQWQPCALISRLFERSLTLLWTLYRRLLLLHGTVAILPVY